MNEVVEWFCGGAADEDPSIHYYVPCIPMAKPELVRAIRDMKLKSVSAVFAALAFDGKPDAPSKPALASLLITLWNAEYEDERDARFINDRVHANIQKDATFSVVPEMPGGITTPKDLMRIAEVAVKYDVPLVKLTGGQRIDLVGITKENLPKVWADLDMPAGWAWGKSYRTCKSCIGTDYCRFGLGDSMGLAQKIEAKFRGIDAPGKLKLATAGCPRNCSEGMVKDVGAVAVGNDKWEIYVGGAAGSAVRKGDVLCTVEGEDAVMHIVGRYHPVWYRENAKYKERTHTFMERMGLERARAVVVDDSRRHRRCAGCGDRCLLRRGEGPVEGARHAEDGKPVRPRPFAGGGLRRMEHAIGNLSQIPPGEGRSFAIGNPARGGVPHQGRPVFATQADCPHRGGPLADGLTDEMSVVCPLHDRGVRFHDRGGLGQ